MIIECKNPPNDLPQLGTMEANQCRRDTGWNSWMMVFAPKDSIPKIGQIKANLKYITLL